MPAYQQQIALHNQQWAEQQTDLRTAKKVISGKDTVYEVPVVFHIIHSGEPLGSLYNPADSVIDSVLVFLNKTFAATWPSHPDVTAGGVRIPIRFVLAKRTPDCKPTNGITRTDGRFIKDYERYGVSIGAREDSLKSVTAWPNTLYYNIWIVRRIEGYGGFAYLYSSAGRRDGTMADISSVTRISAAWGYNYILPHELGHAFSLYHTFEGGCLDTNCLMNGDLICDTEPHTVQGCVSGTNACTGKPYGNTVYNYMNYSNSCADRFTPMQKERMVYSVLGDRLSLLYSEGATPPDPSFVAPTAACIIPALPKTGRNIGPARVMLDSLYSSTGGFSQDGDTGYLDRTCFYPPVHLQEGKSYALQVGSGIEYQYHRAWIDYNNDGTFSASEEVMKTGAFYGNYTLQTDTFTVPRTGVVYNTPLRLRVSADVTASFTACSLMIGQAEDYSVIVHRDTTSAIPSVSAENDIRVFPNPVADQLHILSPQPLDLFLYSLEGRLLMQTHAQTTLQVGSLPNGFYLLRMADAHTGATIRYHKLQKWSN
ncbi:hypothetical protein GCM10023092_13400 [Rurimicrobium arvi]|uniref:Plant heme peroxidase family profile domain-containing protein n=2 Tax=Rurimicrobium arvi TaxID=2049916 RepID=A0ABP8MR87_9BACT